MLPNLKTVMRQHKITFAQLSEQTGVPKRTLYNKITLDSPMWIDEAFRVYRMIPNKELYDFEELFKSVPKKIYDAEKNRARTN